MKNNKWILILLYLAACCLKLHAEEVAILPPGYAVASAHPLATNAGLDLLAQGGNAFDAAIAVASTLAVVAPYDSGLGGGGFWLLHLEKDHKNLFLDSREVAPLSASDTMYLDSKNQVVPGLSLNGGLAAAIPGEPAAYVYLATHYGKLPLAKSLAPAIQLAKNGFVVDQEFYDSTVLEDRLEYLKKFPATAAVFLKQGLPYQRGDILIQSDLAKTLSLIAEQGQRGFYSGEVAQKLVNSVNAAGGHWTLDDLSKYQIKIREPLIGAYHNMLVITAPPPSAGGVSLLTMLNILALEPLSTFSKVTWVHYLVEAMRLAYWQRTEFLGDPDFIKIPVEKLTSAENAKQLNTLIFHDKATASQLLQGPSSKLEHTNTTHFSIIDSEGNRVAATLTVNYTFGSSVMAEGTGVLINNEMDDFSSKVGEKNAYGLVGSDKNAIAPGKRPLSSMTPTFLELPGRVAILGTPGGSRIPSMVLISSLLFNEGYGAITMASAMRFHHQYLPDVIEFEPNAFPLPLQAALKAMGYELLPVDRHYGVMQVITWDKNTGNLTATADPRNLGLATVVRTDKKE